MRVVHTVKEMKEFSSLARENGKTIGFVPTMGFLHEGHLSLVKRAKKKADYVVVSIFVNPVQFGPHEDYEQYPRDLDHDLQLLEKRAVDIVFFPTKEELYPAGNYSTYVVEKELSEGLCGASRPGHFSGVATIVVKLCNIVQPSLAVFGQKDYQQACIIARVFQDLNMDCGIDIAPIVRDDHGLALSSRNAYLSAEEYQDALVLNEALCIGVLMINSGEKKIAAIIKQLEQLITARKSAKVDYVQIVNSKNLQPVKVISNEKSLHILIAVWIGKTRLIDNTIALPSS